jgi:hypothetical protein
MSTHRRFVVLSSGLWIAALAACDRRREIIGGIAAYSAYAHTLSV